MSYDGRIQADARHLPIADESVQMCVTSPPYWGLRDYGHAPLVWDGDADCLHIWGDLERTPWANAVPGPNGLEKNTLAGHWKPKEHGQWCHCGAWRGSFGLEPTPELYVKHSVQIFREVWRVLEGNGTLWLNLGDCYATGAGAVGDHPGGGGQGRAFRDKYWGKHADIGLPAMTQPNRLPIQGLKPKDMVGIPWRVAFALQADGWYLRSDIIWAKKNCMPESVLDRPTRSHEYIFLLTKSERYYYDSAAIVEPCDPQNSRDTTTRRRYPGQQPDKGFRNGRRFQTRNKRDVWHIGTTPYPEAHYATFPPDLIEPCILAGSHVGDFVLDPFAGSNTTGRVAEKHSRRWIACDLGYQDLQEKRLHNVQRVLTETAEEPLATLSPNAAPAGRQTEKTIHRKEPF